jgi:undecaprenyl-diphosphatase
MPLWQVVILAIVQGLTELLPVSSSAHVIVTAELLHQSMSTPANALLLVLLHTGTMFAVIVYFWSRWVDEFFSSWARFWQFVKFVFVATLLSGVVGYPLMKIIEHVLGAGGNRAEIETLFDKLNWIAPALAAVGLLIIYAGLREARQAQTPQRQEGQGSLRWPQAIVMGVLQGIAVACWLAGPGRKSSPSASPWPSRLLHSRSDEKLCALSRALTSRARPCQRLRS